MGGNERTPLILRTTNPPSSSSRRRPRSTFSDDPHMEANAAAAATADNTSVELLWQPPGNNNDSDNKLDRRGLTDRIGSSLSSQLRQARSTLQAMRGYRRRRCAADTSTSNNKPHDISTVLVGQSLEGPASLSYRGRISTLSRSHHPHDWTNEDEEELETTRKEDPRATTTTTATAICSFGTAPQHGIWLVVQDPLGCAVAVTVWILLGYSMFTVLLLTQHGHWPRASAAIYCSWTTLALMSHAKTALSDPGSVPPTAVPPSTPLQTRFCHTHCAACRTYKPARTHHCRICGRCIARMDHHCPWMNS
jgi:hypothetical protein